ncbi:MAG: putative Ig domain-containing protein, partial [Candidatus Thermoplasmatota archaeon]|nr:putative Ig domain-containing protein [Candidatus Thermoplasmatota archaeon]
HARIFEYTNSNQTWWQVGDDIDGQSAGDVLGYAVSISDDGNTIAASSRWDDDGGAESGSAGIYRYTAANNTWWQIGQNVDGLAAGDSLGYDIDLSSDGNRVVIGSPQNDQVGTDSGLIQTFVVSSDAESSVESMLVNVTGHDFRPKQGSQLDILSAGAYDATDNDPWDAGIEWTYSRSSNYTTGCMDSLALNYNPNAGFDDGSCRYLEADLGERVARLNQAIEPITFTESLSNFDFGTWSTGVSNGTTAFSQSWRKPTGSGTDANYDFQDFAIAENGDQAIVFTQNHSGGSTPHSLALMYKPFNGSWSSSIIDNSTNTGFKPSIAIDRTGALHIAYIDNANDTIRYATNVSGSWAFSTLGDAEWTDSHSRKTDIAIDPITDAVYIVHTMKDVGDSGSALEGVRFHTNEGGSWVNESITDRGLKSGYDPQIALDSDGNIHVSYYLDQGSDLKIASRIDGVWQNETVYESDNSGNTPSIAIDSQDVIHIVHMINYASNNKRLTLTSGTLGSWTNTTFGDSALYRHSYSPSIAIDSNDAIHIAYHYGTTSKHLHYISNMTGSWSLETLVSSNAGWGARVSIDNNDDIHIAHSDLTGSGTIAHYLEMTKRTGSGEGLTAHPIFDISPPLPEGLSMNWRNGTITGTPTRVQDSTTYTVWANISERSASTSISISVDWSLRPSVSGVSATLNTAITPITFEWNTTIWESRVTNGSDHPSSATNSNYAGKATDIAADSNGKTHVVSFDDNNDDLRYTTNAGGTWTSSLIHESGNTGRHPSIVIDSNDMIHVVFVRQTGTSLMYMNKSVSATSWSSPTTISSDAWNKATGLALDEDDNLYVSWARNDANYKRQCFVKTKPASSSTWSDLPGLYTHYQSENHQVRTACDVAVDSNKKVHIVAHDASSSSNSGDLRYTTNVSGSWVSSDIRGYSTSSADTGRLVNLVIDSNDKIHLTYIETYGTAKAYHESNVGGSWSRSELAWYADFPAIAIDSNDDLHIALGSSGTIELHQRAASSTGSFSSSTQTTCTGGCDEYISIIADNNDDLHLAFSRHLNHKLGVSYEQGTGKGVKNDPGSWRPVISSISSCEVSPSLPQGLSVNNQRCTLSGTPTEVASNQTYTVWANTSSGDSYSTQVWLRVVQSPPTISYNSNNFILVNNTAMSPSAIPTNSGGPIPSRIIDVGSVGSYTSWGISNDTSIAMDSDGYMHISYRDSTNKTLLYATDKSGSWVTTTVDSEYGSGDASSIALDSNNNVHIVHFESDAWRLRYTTNMSGSWVSSRIVATGFLGFSPSIALDSDDNIHVSYMQADSAYRIKYATNSSGSWVDTTVSPTTTDCSLVSPNICHLAPNAFRTTTSIALDSNDKPHISYTCAGTVSNADLCFTTNAGGSWSYQTLDSSGNTGFDNSLSIDSDNNLHISYYDATNENLRYATNKSGSWDYSSIDQTGDVGHDTSLGIDSDNNVHISYYDKTNRDLKYATNSSGVWTNSTIDSNLDVGTGSSIFIESNDRVHISYQESVSDTDGNLRYITVDNNNSIYGWSINSTLPDGLHFNENTGVISGTPTQLMSSTQYTIQARNSGGASTATINISVNDVAPGPFEYIPENNTVTNNSLVHIAPSFV